MKTTRADYGNWVPLRMVYASLAVSIVMAVLGFVLRSPVIRGIPFALAGLVLLFFLYLAYAYYQFARDGCRLPRQFYRLVIDHLPWDGHGSALDIGTGNGAVAIEIARRFPSATVVGVDLWGRPWSYGRDVCDRNAAIEGVGEHVRFERGSAADLPFESERFDAVASNFVFHTVVTDDRMGVLREALRILRKGGAFAFQDLFNEQFYPDPDHLADELASWGLKDVRLVRSEDHIRVPRLLRVKHMVGGAGVLSGRK